MFEKKKITRSRDSEATKARIIIAARKEFADLGFGGARVDEIAEKANANKRMIYHYYGSKEALFQYVLEKEYEKIRASEKSLKLEHLPANEALRELVTFTWKYYLENPEFLTLVNSENLHRARHLKKSRTITQSGEQLITMVEELLKRGVEEGVFRENVDPVQLNITIASIGYYYLTNRHTGSILFGFDFMSSNALDKRLKFNLETIDRLVGV